MIVVSAGATPGQIRKLRHEGASHYLTKPIAMGDLLNALDDMIMVDGTSRQEAGSL